MMNFTDFQNAEKKLRELCRQITVEMLMGKEPRPKELDAAIEAEEKKIYDYKHANPYAVRVDNGGVYEIIGMYSTEKEAIKNCPIEYAHVYNVITYETTYWSLIQSEY